MRAAFGVLCRLTGMIAGFFELLKGNVATNGLIISTMEPSYSLWTTYGISDLMEI